MTKLRYGTRFNNHTVIPVVYEKEIHMSKRTDATAAATKATTTKGKAAPKTETTVQANVDTIEVPKGYFVSEFFSAIEVSKWAEAKSGNGVKAQVTFTRTEDGKKLWVQFWKQSMDTMEFSAMTGSDYDPKTKQSTRHENKDNKLNGRSWLGHKGKEWWTAHNSIVQMATDIIKTNA